MAEHGSRSGQNGEAHGLEVRPDPEVRVRAQRRRFTAAYKQRILAEAKRCAPGQLGALLRREGLYSSHLTKWRRQAAGGALESKQPTTPERLRNAMKQLAKAERENRRLRQKLQRAETIIDVQKKLSALLRTLPPEAER